MMFLKLVCMAVALLLLLIITPFIYIFSQILQIRWKYRHIPSPKAKSFIIGHAQYFEEMDKKGGHYAMLIKDWVKECGTVFVLYLVNNARVVIMEPSVVKELLVTSLTVKPKSFYGGFHTLFGKTYLGGALFTQLDNKHWAKQRHVLNPAFKKGFVMNLMPQYNASTKELMTVLKSKAEKKMILLMATELNKVTTDIIAKVALGMDDVQVIGEEDTPFSLATRETLQGAMLQIKLPFLSNIDPRAQSRKERNAAYKANTLLREIGRKRITQRLEEMKDGKEYPKDVLTQMLQNYIAGPKITEKEMELMLCEFTTFLIGGSETTAHMMAFTLELVGRHPEIYKKIQEEVDTVIGDKEFITYEDTAKLEYMHLVFKEVMRLIPPVPAIFRMNTEDIVVNGVKVPAGSSIEMNTYAFGRDERFWDEPEKFDPERFRSDTSRNPYAYFPFALGARVCIGQNFALIEAKVIMSKIFQLFDFTLVPGVKLEYLFEVTIKPKNNTPVYLTRRNA